MNEHVNRLSQMCRVENAEDCKTFLIGVLTKPGFLDAAMTLVEPEGDFFCDAMAETTLEEFVKVQQGPVLDLVPDFTILNWRYAVDSGELAIVKFQATASHNGKRATWTCVWIFTLRDGKVAQLEKSFDRGGWHAALGLDPWVELPVQPGFASDSRSA